MKNIKISILSVGIIGSLLLSGCNEGRLDNISRDIHKIAIVNAGFNLEVVHRSSGGTNMFMQPPGGSFEEDKSRYFSQKKAAYLTEVGQRLFSELQSNKRFEILPSETVGNSPVYSKLPVVSENKYYPISSSLKNVVLTPEAIKSLCADLKVDAVAKLTFGYRNNFGQALVFITPPFGNLSIDVFIEVYDKNAGKLVEYYGAIEEPQIHRNIGFAHRVFSLDGEYGLYFKEITEHLVKAMHNTLNNEWVK